MDSALLYSEEDALRKGLPGMENVRISQGQVFLSVSTVKALSWWLLTTGTDGKFQVFHK